LGNALRYNIKIRKYLQLLNLKKLLKTKNASKILGAFLY
jgi:hypothetical protein